MAWYKQSTTDYGTAAADADVRVARPNWVCLRSSPMPAEGGRNPAVGALESTERAIGRSDGYQYQSVAGRNPKTCEQTLCEGRIPHLRGNDKKCRIRPANRERLHQFVALHGNRWYDDQVAPVVLKGKVPRCTTLYHAVRRCTTL